MQAWKTGVGVDFPQARSRLRHLRPARLYPCGNPRNPGPPVRKVDSDPCFLFPYFCTNSGKVSAIGARSEEHTSELQSLMRISYAVFCLNKKNYQQSPITHNHIVT